MELCSRKNPRGGSALLSSSKGQMALHLPTLPRASLCGAIPGTHPALHGPHPFTRNLLSTCGTCLTRGGPPAS